MGPQTYLVLRRVHPPENMSDGGFGDLSTKPGVELKANILIQCEGTNGDDMFYIINYMAAKRFNCCSERISNLCCAMQVNKRYANIQIQCDATCKCFSER